MELTPEERAKIYAEEKARLEIRDQLKRDKPSAFRVGCLILLGIIALLWIVGSLHPTPTPTPEPPLRATYEVSGSGAAALSFRNESGGTEQKTVSLPWTLRLNVKRGAFLYVSAQKQQEYGLIRAVIYADGHVLQTAEANTAYGIASVSGSVR